MDTILFLAVGFLLGLLILAVGRFVDWLMAPVYIAMHAWFAIERAREIGRVERRRAKGPQA